MVTGRLTIPTADGDLLHYSAVASEPLESASKAPAAGVAASSCLRRMRHWQVLVFRSGVDPMFINIEWHQSDIHEHLMAYSWR